MKVKKCPIRKNCFDYKANNCDNCATGDEITKLHKRIDRLKKLNETLTIQRNAWALTAKALDRVWISVDERLPDPTKNVLVCKTFRDKPYIDIGCVKDVETCCCASDEYIIKPWLHKLTHWMPLPEPPKKGGEQG